MAQISEIGFFGKSDLINKFITPIPRLTNFVLGNTFLSQILKKLLRIAPERSLPPLSTVSLRKWYNSHPYKLDKPIKKVYLFCDEFIKNYESPIGIKAVKLLRKLGYEVSLVEHPSSARAAISRGYLLEAKSIAKENFLIFSKLISEDTPLIGIEPSAILTFKDEYVRLVDQEQASDLDRINKNLFLIEEFLVSEYTRGYISSENFTLQPKKILLHTHCHQKSLTDHTKSAFALSIPQNYEVELIQAGCCGMAGSFGYEKEHYEISAKIANLSLLPAIENTSASTVISAVGTSCRHQIKDLSSRHALHPIELLWEALK